MDQTLGRIDSRRAPFAPNRLLLVAGLAQIVATFSPAAHIRLLGNVAFVRLPTAGMAFIVIGLLAGVAAILPRGWWRWVPGVASLVVLAVVYARLRWAPSGGFFDPVLRRAVRPAWGFLPMTCAGLLMLGAAAKLHFENRASNPTRADVPESQ